MLTTEEMRELLDSLADERHPDKHATKVQLVIAGLLLDIRDLLDVIYTELRKEV